MTNPDEKPMVNPAPSTEGLSPTAGDSRATNQRESWLDKTVPNRAVGAFHAGRLVNVFSWYLNQAYVLRNGRHFARAMQVIDRMVVLSEKCGDDADQLLVPRLEGIRITCAEAWSSEEAAEQLDSRPSELENESETSPERIRWKRSLTWAQPRVSELRIEKMLARAYRCVGETGFRHGCEPGPNCAT